MIDTFLPVGESKYYICTQCEYVISSIADAGALRHITVYVLGNSLSKQRQGLGGVLLEEGGEPDKEIRTDMEQMMEKNGFFASAAHGKYIPGRPQDDHIYWIFTNDAWKKAQADQEFRLADGQYIVDVKEMY